MVIFENIISEKTLDKNKLLIVPHIMSNNYFNVLKLKIKKEKLNSTQTHYYNHFIKKKLIAAAYLFDIKDEIFTNGKEFMINNRINEAKKIIKQMERIHKNQKILISGSFLWNETYNDIDIFIISKYEKKDYKKGNMHFNYLPIDIEKKLFFGSISSISVSNFNIEKMQEYDYSFDDLISIYQELIIYILQGNNFKNELRELIMTSAYLSENVVLNSMQIAFQENKIMKSKNKIFIINNLVINVLTLIYNDKIREELAEMIKTNDELKNEYENSKNLEIYNQTYGKVLEIEN